MKEEHYDFIPLNGNHDIEEKWFKVGLEHRHRRRWHVRCWLGNWYYGWHEDEVWYANMVRNVNVPYKAVLT
ncbi:hypothetical protein HZ326_30388 [Fusarium oxysporum f. sp. albedinis]|nr:hypothetical protein HZ326_30388 [Fusarium oxysporum f. sp. albedinis]